jgi:hypothetical protein
MDHASDSAPVTPRTGAPHRPADASGLNTYTTMLQQGQTEALVLAILAGSDEYFGRA